MVAVDGTLALSYQTKLLITWTGSMRYICKDNHFGLRYFSHQPRQSLPFSLAVGAADAVHVARSHALTICSRDKLNELERSCKTRTANRLQRSVTSSSRQTHRLTKSQMSQKEQSLAHLQSVQVHVIGTTLSTYIHLKQIIKKIPPRPQEIQPLSVTMAKL